MFLFGLPVPSALARPDSSAVSPSPGCPRTTLVRWENEGSACFAFSFAINSVLVSSLVSFFIAV